MKVGRREHRASPFSVMSVRFREAVCLVAVCGDHINAVRCLREDGVWHCELTHGLRAGLGGAAGTGYSTGKL
jgi:hypothetical protein